MPTLAKPTEIMPGDVYRRVGGKHDGLRVEVLRDSGTAVKVKVIRNQGANGGHKMVGERWSVERSTFLTVYKKESPERVANHQVERDLGRLVAAMPVVKEAESSVRLDGSTQSAPVVAAPAYPEREYEAEMERERMEQAADARIEQALSQAEKSARWHSLHDAESREKRNATLQARVASFTQDQRNEIKRRRVAGDTVFKLARDFGLDVTWMGRLLVDIGAPTPKEIELLRRKQKRGYDNRRDAALRNIQKQYDALTEEQKRGMVEKRRAGASYWALLNEYKVINAVLKRVLDEAGIATGEKFKAQPATEPVKAQQKQADVTVTPHVTGDTAKRDPARYKAVVVVMKPVEQELPIDADSFDDALVLAKAYDGVIRVKSLSEL